MSTVESSSQSIHTTAITARDARYATIVALFAWIFSVYDYILFGTLLPRIAQAFGWSTTEATVVLTFVSVGTFVVAMGVGPMIDRIGRRRGLIVSTVGAALSSGLTAVGLGAIWIVVVRAFSGLGYSEQAVNATYLNELYAAAEETEGRARRKGFTFSLAQAGWPIGVLFAAAMTAVLLPATGWRGVFIVATFPAVVVAFLGKRLKETPQFLAMREAREAARAGDGEGTGRNRTGPTLLALFSREQRRHTVFLGVAFLLNWVGVQVVSVLGTTVLTEAKGITFGGSLTMLIASNAAALLGYLTFGAVGDRVGRRGTVVVSWFLGGACFAGMLFLADGYWPVLLSYSLALFFLIGPYSALLFYMSESYPTRLRGTGTAFVNAMGPLGAIVGSGVFAGLLAAGLPMTVTAALAGALSIVLSGLLLLGARRAGTGAAIPAGAD